MCVCVCEREGMGDGQIPLPIRRTPNLEGPMIKLNGRVVIELPGPAKDEEREGNMMRCQGQRGSTWYPQAPKGLPDFKNVFHLSVRVPHMWAGSGYNAKVGEAWH